MNDEFTLQDLIDLLVKRHGMEQADADAFVKLFFSLIEEGLSSDRYVKIKGLGTFKLIDTRITFTPDSTMKELVNKPFSHFETVKLNDNVHFDDLSEGEFMANEESKTVEVSEEKSNSDLIDVAVKEENLSQQIEKTRVSTSSMRLPWCMILSVLLIGAIVGGFMVWSMFRASHTVEISTSAPVEPVVGLRQDTIVADTTAESGLDRGMDKDSLGILQPDSQDVAAVTPAQNEKTRKMPLSDTVSYEIVGTRAVHQLQYGETLVKLAQRYYGNKKLWPYIARYNQKHLKNADDIHVGTMIQIPDLSPQKSH